MYVRLGLSALGRRLLLVLADRIWGVVSAVVGISGCSTGITGLLGATLGVLV